MDTDFCERTTSGLAFVVFVCMLKFKSRKVLATVISDQSTKINFLRCEGRRDLKAAIFVAVMISFPHNRFTLHVFSGSHNRGSMAETMETLVVIVL